MNRTVNEMKEIMSTAYMENDRKPRRGRNDLSNARERCLVRADFIGFKILEHKRYALFILLKITESYNQSNQLNRLINVFIPNHLINQ